MYPIMLLVTHGILKEVTKTRTVIGTSHANQKWTWKLWIPIIVEWVFHTAHYFSLIR